MNSSSYFFSIATPLPLQLQDKVFYLICHSFGRIIALLENLHNGTFNVFVEVMFSWICHATLLEFCTLATKSIQDE
jgi:hypothetical protein